jgi:F0F1-type ATP synthase epsilon subunit
MIKLKIVTNNDSFLTEGCESVLLPGEYGDFTILKSHTPFIAPVATGLIQIKHPKLGLLKIVCSSGVSQIHDDTINIITPRAYNTKDYSYETVYKLLQNANAENLSEDYIKELEMLLSILPKEENENFKK